jgi:exonuclease SbcC
MKFKNKKNELDNLKMKKEEYNSKKKEIENNKKDINESKRLNSKLKDLTDELDDINEEFISLGNKLKKNEKELIEVNQTLSNFEILEEDIKNLDDDKNQYSIIEKTLKNDGIVDTIMKKNLLPLFSEIVNGLLARFNSRKVNIEFIGSEIIIRDEYNVNTVRDGGYQTFFNNLIYRIALAELNSSMKTNFMIIDEAFDSSDNDNKQKIKELIVYLREKYDWTLIISHDDNVKDLFESILSIKHVDVKNKSINFK